MLKDPLLFYLASFEIHAFFGFYCYFVKMVESEKDFELLSSIPVPEPELEERENNLTLDSDETVLLCRVCGYKAKGINYGVYSCKACANFIYTRCKAGNLSPPPCKNDQLCSKSPICLRNCADCRLKKCIALGMSKDFQTVCIPKHKKIQEAQEKDHLEADHLPCINNQQCSISPINFRSCTDCRLKKCIAGGKSKDRRTVCTPKHKEIQGAQEKDLDAELDDEAGLLDTILEAHRGTCDYIKLVCQSQPVCTQIQSRLPCLLNLLYDDIEIGDSNNVEDFSERFAPAINGVVEFAKRIPCFGFLSLKDQQTLLKDGVFEVLFVLLTCMFDSEGNSFICSSGKALCRESLKPTSKANLLLFLIFSFAKAMNDLNLSGSEIGLFCAVVIIDPNRKGLVNNKWILKIQNKIMDILNKLVIARHPENPFISYSVSKMFKDLKTINNQHSKRLLAYKM